MGYIADNVRRFFHPAAVEEMLSAFVPRMNGTELNVSPLHVLPTAQALTPYAPPEYSSLAVLYADLPPSFTPTILSPHVIPNMGIREFLHV
jgi:hypothetical protein